MKVINGLILLLLITFVASAQKKLTYRVEYSVANVGHLHVVIQLPNAKKCPATFVMPRAIPSGYAQQFYDRFVENVSATSGGGATLRIEREEGPRWRVGNSETDVVKIEYDVDLSRLEREIESASDTSKARPEYVGLLGYSVFGYVEGFENEAVRLEVTGPAGWPVFSTLSPKVPADTTQTNAAARNFYELADSQIAMGPKLQTRRLEAPLPLFLIFYAETESDLNKHAQTFADAFRKVLDYFGNAPFDHYTGYIEILKPISAAHEYGFSMEHLNSSTYFLGVDRVITSTTTPLQLGRERYNFAHHVAHSWIPKKVYGQGYLPFTWELAPQIDTIWFNEGFARYVAIEAIADAMSDEEARQFRQRQFDLLHSMLSGIPGFIRTMPLLELSRVGSLMYSADFRIGRTLFGKGALMALEIDQMIRERTNGKKRLRDSLRSLVKWGEQSGRAFRHEELPGLIAKPVGLDEREVAKIFQRWLAGN
jgi:predicted metalloprotease with PDZ domain